MSLNEVIYRASFIVSIPEKQIKKTGITIKEHIELYKDYKTTKEYLKELKSKE